MIVHQPGHDFLDGADQAFPRTAHVGGRGWVEVPIDPLSSCEVVDVVLLQPGDEVLQLRGGTDEVGPTIRIRVGGTASAVDETAEGTDERIGVGILNYFKVDAANSKACVEDNPPFQTFPPLYNYVDLYNYLEVFDHNIS